MTKHRNKFLLFSGILVLFTLTASAQGFDFGGSSFQAEENLLQYMNQVLLTYEVNSIGEFFFFFLLPLAGFYLINTNIFKTGFEAFEDRIGREHYGRRSDDVPTGLKGIALVTAFLTVQVAGVFGAILLLTSSALAFVAWFLNHVGLLSDWSNGRNNGGGGNNGGGNGGMGEPPQEIMDRIDDLENQITEGENAENEADEDADDGLPEDAKDAIEAALGHFERGETDLLEVFELTQAEIRNVKGDFQNAVGFSSSIDAKIKDDLNRLENNIVDIETGGSDNLMSDLDFSGVSSSDLTSLMDDYSNGGTSQTNVRSIVESNVLDNMVSAYSPGHIDFSSSSGGIKVQNLSSDVLDISNDIKGLTDLLANLETSGNLHEDIIEAVELLNVVAQIGMFLNELGGDIDWLLEEERYLIEMVQKAESKDLMGDGGGLIGSLRNDRRKAKELKSKIQQIESEYSNLISEADALYNEINSFLGISEADVAKLISDTSPGRPHGLKQIAFRLEIIARICSHDLYSNYDGSDAETEINQALSNLSSSLNELNGVKNLLASGGSHPTQKLQQVKSQLDNIRSNL